MEVFDISKYQQEEEVQETVEEVEIVPTIKTAEQMMWDGFRPKHTRTQQDLDECQTLMAGAVQLMYQRVTGQTEFDISERQYKQFLVNCKEETKLFTWGFITLDEAAEWVYDEINVEYAE